MIMMLHYTSNKKGDKIMEKNKLALDKSSLVICTNAVINNLKKIDDKIHNDDIYLEEISDDVKKLINQVKQTDKRQNNK